MKTKLISTIVLVMLSVTTFSQTWSNVGSGYPITVQAMVADSINNRVVFSGNGSGVYTTNGIVTSNTTIAYFGVNVTCLAFYNNELYAGYTLPPYIKKFNGSSWVNIGTINNCQGVYAMCVFNNKLYIGGNFQSIGTTSVNVGHMAAYDGTTLTPIASGINAGISWGSTYKVASMCVYNGSLCVGGLFDNVRANNISTNITNQNIALFNGTSWNPMGSGLPNTFAYPDGVLALTIHNNTLYAGGVFTGIIKSWNGSTWGALAGGVFTGSVNTLCSYDNELYAGGTFTVNSNQYISRWNGSTWYNVGTGVNNTINHLKVLGNELYAGGTFTLAGGVTSNHIAKWNNNLSTGVNELTSNFTKIYPNPVVDNLIVESEIDANHVIITDITGKELNSYNFDNNTNLNMLEYQNGVYFVIITNKKETKKFKIIKTN